MGNSSSGIIEVPYFKIPTINIGDRQSGRIRHESIIDVGYSTESIKSGIEKALSKTFCGQLSSMNYKFGDGHAAERIINKFFADYLFSEYNFVYYIVWSIFNFKINPSDIFADDS